MVKETWHALSIREIFKILKTSEEGLTSSEAIKRFNEIGPNEIVKEKRVTPLQLFLSQFKSFLIILLIVACLISISVGEILNSLVIFIILIINAILGFFQEYKAEKAVEALKRMISPKALVLRDGEKQEIPSRELVPGDIVYLEEGKYVPADLRLIESHDLKVDESILTGESLPVLKNNLIIKEEVPISDIKNMVFMGTHVVYGRGKGVVVNTGMDTEMGEIAELVQETKEEETPLKLKINALGKNLGLIVLVIITLVFILNLYFREMGLIETFILAIAMAVAAVPEGLPMVITLTLALGMQAMAAKKAIVKKLMAVETLGATTVICSDKTGTLTKNEMTVRKIFVDWGFVKVTGSGYKPIGSFLIKDKKINVKRKKTLFQLIKIGVMCNNATLIKKDGWKLIGDPTEGALLTLAEKAGINVEKLKNSEKFILEIPFSSERKMMSVIYKRKEIFSYVKVAPEKIIPRCSYILSNGKIRKLRKNEKNEIEKIAENMAGEPLRVLALAYKKLSKKKRYFPKIAESNLIFVGLVGMIDPPRKEVKEAIKVCKEAGIKTVMITGDHKVTAVAIAKEIGILEPGDMIVTGAELESMSLKELKERIMDISVYARVSPEHKVKILQAFEARGETIAMTGDGVNDAPALKKAHIGVAMGIKGTDVAKEASDMILEDDNFATIVKAIEGGRRIYENIKKFIRFQLAANFSEIVVISFSALAGLPLPLLPLQILWINLVTDTIPATALAVDPPEKDIMKRPPRKRDENIIMSILPFVLSVVTLMCFLVVWAYLWGLQYGIEKARTITFTTIVVFQFFLVFNCRSETKPFLQTKPFENKFLIIGVIISFLLQLGVIYLEPLQLIFGTTPLNYFDWIVVSLFSITGLAISPAMFKKIT